jgi:hypothetical protein
MRIDPPSRLLAFDPPLAFHAFPQGVPTRGQFPTRRPAYLTTRLTPTHRLYHHFP